VAARYHSRPSANFASTKARQFSRFGRALEAAEEQAAACVQFGREEMAGFLQAGGLSAVKSAPVSCSVICAAKVQAPGE